MESVLSVFFELALEPPRDPLEFLVAAVARVACEELLPSEPSDDITSLNSSASAIFARKKRAARWQKLRSEMLLSW